MEFGDATSANIHQSNCSANMQLVEMLAAQGDVGLMDVSTAMHGATSSANLLNPQAGPVSAAFFGSSNFNDIQNLTIFNQHLQQAHMMTEFEEAAAQNLIGMQQPLTELEDQMADAAVLAALAEADAQNDAGLHGYMNNMMPGYGPGGLGRLS